MLLVDVGDTCRLQLLYVGDGGCADMLREAWGHHPCLVLLRSDSWVSGLHNLSVDIGGHSGSLRMLVDFGCPPGILGFDLVGFPCILIASNAS